MLKIFISYTSERKALHLHYWSYVTHSNKMELFHFVDMQLQAGDDWKAELEENIKRFGLFYSSSRQ